MTRDSRSSPTSTLYRGGVVHNPADPLATSMVVADDQIAWIGTDQAAGGLADGVDHVVDLGGALVTPTFVDAHAHTSATGMGLRSTELTGVRSLQDALAAIEVAARKRAGRPVYAPNWDEQDWPECRPPTAQELDRATYGGVVYSPRVDGHSAVISSALAAASGARNHPGWTDSGLVTREAHHAARDTFYAGSSPAERRADVDAALSAAAAAGIGLIHEIGGPMLSSGSRFCRCPCGRESWRWPAGHRLLGRAGRRRAVRSIARQPPGGPWVGRRPQHRRLDRLADRLLA